MSKVDVDKRKEQISNLYRKVLKREPDDPGLNSYLFSDVSLETIEEAMKTSQEFMELQRKENFGRQLKSLGTSELLLMGSSPRSDEHVKSLMGAGVSALLNLDGKLERPYNHSWCENYLHVPLDKKKYITVEQMSSILDFLYTNVVLEGNKTFIHSDLGVSRSPMITALFLVAEKKLSFLQALNLIAAKQRMVNPGQELLSGEVLEFVKNYTFRGGGRKRHSRTEAISASGKPGTLEFLSLNEALLIGRKLTDSLAAKFRKADIDVIVDLNEKRTKLPTDAQWFSHIHLPLVDDKINEMIPVVIRNVRKYTRRGKVFVLCDETPKLMLFSENYALNSDDAMLKGRMMKIREQILSL